MTYQTPPYWQQAIADLSQSDPIMAAIIARYPNEAMQGKANAFLTLMRSITGQQISVKAADAIWARLELACKGNVEPHVIKKLDEPTLRLIGYSRQKVSYLHSLAEFFITRQHLERDWATMSDEQVLKDITQIKGIGVWTAEMFLMFHLLRPNILPLGDIGLINAASKFYNGGTKMAHAEVTLLAEKWQPWRTVATWYLWRTYDDEPVNY